MAGFLDRESNILFKGLRQLTGPIRKLLRMGQEYDDLILKQKIGLGTHETALIRSGSAEEQEIFIANQYDINPSRNKTIGFYQKDYESQRNFLQKMSSHREITKFVDIIADEAIVFDKNGYFCQPNASMLEDFSEEKLEEVKEKLQENFEHIYSVVFDFKDTKGAWRFFRDYLIEGIIAFQLVFDYTGKQIIKAIPIDAARLAPDVKVIDGQKVSGWTQNPGEAGLETFLPDTHVVYISYGKSINSSEISYVQSLIRSFNLFRTIENTASIWTIMNSSFRLKMIVPTSGSGKRGQASIGKMVAKFREDVQIDSDSGEVTVNGQAALNLFRNYAIASKDGQQTTIESMKFEGYDMSNPELLKYWRDKLWEDSQIPFSRLQKDSSSTFLSSVDGFEREEMRFGKFISRLRSDFQEIISKALYIQMYLDFPDLEGDYFKSKIGIIFNKENIFEEQRAKEAMLKSLEFIKGMRDFQDDDNQPYWDLDFLLEEFGAFSLDVLQGNKKRKEEKAKNKKPNKKQDNSTETQAETDEDSLDLGVDVDNILGGGETAAPDSEPTPDLGTETGAPETTTDDSLDLDLDI